MEHYANSKQYRQTPAYGVDILRPPILLKMPLGTFGKKLHQIFSFLKIKFFERLRNLNGGGKRYFEKFPQQMCLLY